MTGVRKTDAWKPNSGEHIPVKSAKQEQRYKDETEKTVARRGIASGPVFPETVEMVQPVELCGPCAVRDARVQVVAAVPVVALRRLTCLIITTTPLPSK